MGGIYADGRRRVDPHRQLPGRPSTGRVVRAEAEWLVLLPGRLPAYSNVEQDHANRARLAANAARAETPRGRPGRVGAAVRPGALRPLRPTHDRALPPPRADDPARVRLRPAGDRLRRRPALPSLAGACVDALVTEQVVAALAPAALEVSLHAAQQVQAERAELERVWQQRLERAAIAARRARRCYRLAEPENRLVTRQLEADWEAALADSSAYARTTTASVAPARVPSHLPSSRPSPPPPATSPPCGPRPPPPTSTANSSSARSSNGSPSPSRAAANASRSRSPGPAATPPTARDVRPVARLDQLSSYPQLLRRVRELAEDGHRAHAITRRLHAEGFRPAKGRDRIGVTAISQLLRELGYPPTSDRARPAPPPGQAPGPDEWWLDDLATELGMPPITLHSWLRRGWVHGRKETTPPHRWTLHADRHELAELRQRRTRPPGWYTRRRWADPPPPTRHDQGQAASSHLSVHRG